MEIIFELAASLFLYIFECLLYAVFELLASFLGNALIEPFRRPQPLNPILAGIGYLIYGGLVGFLSILILPKLFLFPQWLRLINLILVPIICGLIMRYYGNYRERSKKSTIGLNTFLNGFLFAFAMALVRYIYR